jgi:hypothetical protein
MPMAPLPWIGHFPHERATQKRVVIAALCAVRWFELEAPPWAQPLPLKAEDCYALFTARIKATGGPICGGSTA